MNFIQGKDMKKTYTKKQITEAIAYWEKQLKKLNESDLEQRPVDIGGKISLQTTLNYEMKLPPGFTLQVTFNNNAKASTLVPADGDGMLSFSYAEMLKHSDASIEIVTSNEYTDTDYNNLDVEVKKALRKVFGVGFTVHIDEPFMMPYKDKNGRTWYIAFISFTH